MNRKTRSSGVSDRHLGSRPIALVGLVYAGALLAACDSPSRPSKPDLGLIDVNPALCVACNADACPEGLECRETSFGRQCVALCDAASQLCPLGLQCTFLPSGESACLSGQGACPRPCIPGWSDCNGDRRDGCETRLGSDTDCASCGHRCDTTFTNGAGRCQDAECRLVACDDGWADCDGSRWNGCEADLGSDGNCGACGRLCQGSVQNRDGECIDGHCELTACWSGWGDCDGNEQNGCETRLGTARNCGACGDACAQAGESDGWSCLGGRCILNRCDPSTADCDGDDRCEARLGTLETCSGCGDDCSRRFPNGGGTCDTSRGHAECQLTGCDPDHADCDRQAFNGCETDLTAARDHCGACGHRCEPVPHASVRCLDGRCEIDECEAGWGDCNGSPMDGCETPLSSPGNCGSCGADCAPGEGCFAGRCGCEDGFADCDGDPANGCEASLGAPGSCGRCGNDCSAQTPNAEAACINGRCAIDDCREGFENCDGNLRNGCETDTLRSANHCGGCGIECQLPRANGACIAGQCVIAGCMPGFGDCDGRPENGCEVPTDLDRLNCGACGNTCEAGSTRGTADCIGGVCRASACEVGFGNCDGDDQNRCETPISADPDNCGGCGLVCQRAPNIEVFCRQRVCGLGDCLAGFADCNGSPNDGCEVELDTTLEHCGACRSPCNRPHAQMACEGGQCNFLACDPGYFDCDGIAENGCETLGSNDRQNCGGCGNVCPGNDAGGVPECIMGRCQRTPCNHGLANCDLEPSNHCEVDTRIDIRHCGVCHQECPDRYKADGSCVAGICSLICAAGFGDCNGDPTDGCEKNLLTDVEACGACATPCAGDCVDGICQVMDPEGGEP